MKRKRRIVPSQQTFSQINGINKIHTLNDKQRKVLSLVHAQCFQSVIAERLHVSPSFISQTIHRFIDWNLIKPLKTEKGKRHHLFELSPELTSAVKKEVEIIFTPIRAHHFIRKFHIISQSGPVNKDKRTGYQKSWKMRGGERHKYWFPGKAGMPSVTIDVHPKTLLAYLDKGQTIAARDEEEAKQIGWSAIMQAKQQFIEQQELFGIRFVIENVGQQVGQIHGGLVMKEEDPIYQEVKANGGQTGFRDWHGDGSPPPEGIVEIESETEENWTRAGRLLRKVEEFDKVVQPEAFKELEKIGAMNDTILRIEDRVTGNISFEQRMDNFTGYLSKIMDEMAAIRQENAELKKRLESRPEVTTFRWQSGKLRPVQ